VTGVSSALILIAIAVIPFIYTNLTIDPVLLPRFLLLAVVTLLLPIVLAVERKKHSVPNDLSILSRGIFIVAALYCGLCVLSLSQTANIGESLFQLSKTITPFIFLGAISVAMVRNPSLMHHISRTLTVVALLLALVGWCQYLNIAFTSLPGNIVPYGTMANKNLLASAIFLCVPFIFYTLTKTTRLWTACSCAALIVSLALIVISRTRGVWVALVAATVVTAILAVLFRKRLRDQSRAAGAPRRGLRAAVIAVVLVAVVGGIYLAGRDDLALLDRATSIVSMKDQSVKDRLGIWGNSLAMFTEHPALGVGPGEWRTHISGYGNVGLRSESGVIHFQRPHNDYLWVLTETGVAGLLAYLLVFVIALVYAVRLIRANADRLTTIRGLILIYGLIGYGVVAFFSYPRERIFHSMLLMLILGILTASYHRLKPVCRKLPGVALKGALVVVAGTLILGLTAGSLRLAAEQHLNRAYTFREMGRWEKVIEEIDFSQTFFMSTDPMSTPLVWYRGVAEFSLGRYDSALVDFQRAYRINPTHIHVLNNLATTYEINGNHAEAIRLFERVLEISPQFDETLLNLAAVYYNTGEFEKANERISRVSPDCADDRYETFMNLIKQRLNRQGNDR